MSLHFTGLSLHRMRTPFFRRIVFAAQSIVLTGCQWTYPVEGRSCIVRDVGGGRVEFGADIRNKQSKPIDRMYIIVNASGKNPYEYELHGSFPPYQWEHERSVKYASEDLTGTLDWHIGSVSQCYPHLIYYADGTTWNIGTPL